MKTVRDSTSENGRQPGEFDGIFGIVNNINLMISIDSTSSLPFSNPMCSWNVFDIKKIYAFSIENYYGYFKKDIMHVVMMSSRSHLVKSSIGLFNSDVRFILSAVVVRQYYQN